MAELSVILISKNQEWNVDRLIRSVLDETSDITDREVVLVDSASTDRTVDVASAYPITILRLHADQHLSAAAGRYIGYKNTSGGLVLFLDGDMELCSGWLRRAMAVMDRRTDVAVVSGSWLDLPRDAQRDNKDHSGFSPTSEEEEDVRSVGGAGMFRRTVLEQVGPFNPFLYSDEEPELCLRIRHAGYRVIKLWYPISYHYSDPAFAISTLVKRRRRNLWLGMGQSMRYHLGTDLFWPYVKERGYGCAPAIAATIGSILVLILVFTGRGLWAGLCLLGLVSAIVAGALRRRSLYALFYSIVHRLMIADGTVRGSLITPRDPSSYLGRFDVVRASGSRGY